MFQGDTPRTGEVGNYGLYDSAEDKMCHLVHSNRVHYSDTEELRRTYRTQAPARNSILRWVGNYRTTGGVGRRQGHGRLATSSEIQQTILTYFKTCPRRSIRRAERDLSIPRSTIHVILRRRIRMSPHTLRIVRKLEARDYVARRVLAVWCLKNL